MPVRNRWAASAATAALVLCALPDCTTGPKSPLASANAIERAFAAAAVTWDLNKDGDVTCQEWKQYVTGLFRDADANHDGILTREEFAVMARNDRLFESVGHNFFDANADGRLSLSELAEKPNPAFTLLDRNHDCVLTSEERTQTSLARSESPRSKGAGPISGRRRE